MHSKESSSRKDVRDEQQSRIYNGVTCTVVLTHCEPSGIGIAIRGRVVRVEQPVVIAERALTGVDLATTWSGTRLPHMAFVAGLLARVEVAVVEVNRVLDAIANEEPAVVSSVVSIRPMAEPCARVPLSLLRELRGQESWGEEQRRAIVQAWSNDRRTGK